MNIRGFFQKHIGSSQDYTPRNSLVNKARREGLSKPLVGAGIGAAVGGAAGYLWGTHNLSQDQVTISTETSELTRPVLVGADYDSSRYWTTTSTDADGNMQIQHHHEPADWDPIIERVPTGQVEQKDVINHSTGFGPVAGTLVGMGVGAIAGALVTSLTKMIKDEPPGYYDRPKVPETEKDQKLARLADKAPLVGAAAGTVIGAAGGALAGHIAAGKNVVLEQVVAEPVYETRTIGYIPRVSQKSEIPRELFHTGQKIYYRELPDNRWGSPHFSDRGQAINRKYFTGDYQDVAHTENSHWLTPAKGALVGAGVGAVAGLATGVAGGILMKIAAGEDPPKRVY